jgi:hypothetical protein
MPCRVEIEDIEKLRRQEGIDDVDLRRAVRALRVGDAVRVTLLTGRQAFGDETLLGGGTSTCSPRKRAPCGRTEGR